MKTWIEAKILAPMDGPHRIDRTVLRFAASTDGWRLLTPERESSQPPRKDDADLVRIVYDRTPQARLALRPCHTRSFQRFCLVAITPTVVQRIEQERYNQITMEFVRELRIYNRANKCGLRISHTAEHPNLKTIVKGAHVRRFLERFLNGYPTSWHPTDVERLDHFVVAVFRYKADIPVELLKQYLREDMGWDEEDAQSLATRLEVGGAILRANRTFGGVEFDLKHPELARH